MARSIDTAAKAGKFPKECKKRKETKSRIKSVYRIGYSAVTLKTSKQRVVPTTSFQGRLTFTSGRAGVRAPPSRYQKGNSLIKQKQTKKNNDSIYWQIHFFDDVSLVTTSIFKYSIQKIPNIYTNNYNNYMSIILQITHLGV